MNERIKELAKQARLEMCGQRGGLTLHGMTEEVGDD